MDKETIKDLQESLLPKYKEPIYLSLKLVHQKPSIRTILDSLAYLDIEAICQILDNLKSRTKPG